LKHCYIYIILFTDW